MPTLRPSSQGRNLRGSARGGVLSRKIVIRPRSASAGAFAPASSGGLGVAINDDTPSTVSAREVPDGRNGRRHADDFKTSRTGATGA